MKNKVFKNLFRLNPENCKKHKDYLLKKQSNFYIYSESIENYIIKTPSSTSLNVNINGNRIGDGNGISLKNINLKTKLTKNNNYIHLYNYTTNEECFDFQLSSKNDDFKDNFQYSKKFNIEQYDDYFVINNRFIHINKTNLKSPIIVMTDLDGTLVGNIVAIHNFNNFWMSNFMLQNNNKLIYSTGRVFKSFEEKKSTIELIWPDVLGCGCGSSIYIQDIEKNIMVLDQEWAKRVTKNWNRAKLKVQFDKLDFLIASTYIDEFCLQYTVSENVWNENKQKVFDILENIKSENILAKSVIIGVNPEKKLLDIFPVACGKSGAMHYLSDKYKIQMKDILICGDSANDIDMFEESEWGVVVKNAQSDLINWYNNIDKTKKPNIRFSNQTYAWAIRDELIKRFEDQTILKYI